MVAAQEDDGVSDELSRGRYIKHFNSRNSSKEVTAVEDKHILTIEKEFRVGEGRALLGLKNRVAHSKSNGIG